MCRKYVWCRCATSNILRKFNIYIYILIQSYTLKLWCYFLNLLGRLTLSFLWSRRGRNWGCKERSCKILKNHCIIRAAASEKMLHWGWKHYSGTICTIFWTGKEKKIAIQSKQILNLPRIWTMFVAGVDLFFLWPKVYDFFKNQPGYPGDPWKPWFSLENDLNVGVTLVHQVIALWLR